MKTEHTTANDLHALQDFLHSVFLRNDARHPRFEALYPEIFQPTDAAMSRHKIIRDDAGNIAACVGMYPMTLRMLGCDVSVAGIGQVSTAEHLLGRGCMTQLLNETIADMRTQRIAVAWLSGRYSRYARFGWEACAAFSASRISGARFRPSEEFVIAKHAAGTYAITDAMLALRETSSYFVADDAAGYNIRTRREGTALWTASDKNGTLLAWALAQTRHCKIIDHAGANDDALLALFRHAAQDYGELSVAFPECGTVLGERVREMSDDFGIGRNMLLIVSLAETLCAYAPLINARLPEGVGATLCMTQPDGTTERADIGGGGDAITLDPRKMARLLFGPERAGDIPGTPRDATALNAVFPLPFYLPELFHV